MPVLSSLCCCVTEMRLGTWECPGKNKSGMKIKTIGSKTKKQREPLFANGKGPLFLRYPGLPSVDMHQHTHRGVHLITFHLFWSKFLLSLRQSSPYHGFLFHPLHHPWIPRGRYKMSLVFLGPSLNPLLKFFLFNCKFMSQHCNSMSSYIFCWVILLV